MFYYHLLIILISLFYYQIKAKEYIIPLLDNSGSLRAVSDDNDTVVVFKGVRYAAPPIDELRWRPPQKYIPNDVNVVRNATEFGNACIQEVDDMFINKIDEDCLFLNVNVGVNILENIDKNTQNVPVLVFIHGGSYVRGAGMLYRGEDMINYWNNQVIVVTLEYRLNIFGFLGSDELRSRDEASGSTGNYGLQDQRLALEWVQHNIAAFGGDPNRVTIMGESAGGGSISNHLTMKKSWGLFSGAIIESGSFSQWVCINMTRAQNSFDQLLSVTDCEDVTCLVNTDADMLFEAATSLPSYTVLDAENFPYAPTVDGVEILSHPWISLTNGDIVDVPLLHGTNTDEGLLFTTLPRKATHEDLMHEWSDVQGYSVDNITKLQQIYGLQNYTAVPTVSRFWWQGQRSLGDKWMSCPAEYTSQKLAERQDRHSPTFMYHFEHSGYMSHFVVHGAEMAYAFHWNVVAKTEADANVADIVSSYWGNFIVGMPHDVNCKAVGRTDLSEWPRFSKADGGMVQIILNEGEVSTSNKLKDDECNFFIRYIDDRIRADFD